ncbi:MAG: PAS domain S-box protein [Cyanobacteria bacterium P01_G01_bin.19]
MSDNLERSTAANDDDDLYVVGIGASAGGLSALEELFSNLSTNTGAAFVVIQHLSPDFKSLMKELLERRTTMPVHRVTEGMKLEPNSVYLIPPGQNLALDKNLLRLEDRKRKKNSKLELNFPIDLFFTSLAQNYGEQSVGVILSGSGSDGTRGLKAIEEKGGIVLVQDPETAEFDGMPLSAISTGTINQILPPRELANSIYRCIVNPIQFTDGKSNKNHSISSDDLNSIAQLLIKDEGLDFSQYKSSTISRRIHRRCLIHNTESINSYIQLLQSSSKERKILCSDLLINVTHFFRDYPAWQNLENNILPRLIEQNDPDKELRFWITACSTGEEAYSLAILVHEALQDSGKDMRVKIFATDIDRTALEKASQGIYPASIARDIGQERLQRYFIAKDNSYQIMRKIREMLIFSPHDLTKDAGFTRIDLITCRNVLIYMKPDLQYKILRNLHFSLVSRGILFLGEAETLGEFESEFEPLDKKWKFYQKYRDSRLTLPLKSTPQIGNTNSLRFTPTPQKIKFESILEQCLERLSDKSNSIVLMIDRENHLLHVSGDSSKIFQPPGGKITTEVTKMVVPPLQLPLSTALHRVKNQEKSVVYQGINITSQGESLDISLEVIPSQKNRRHGNFLLVQIEQQAATEGVTNPQVENFELDNEASRRIMELESELQHTRENLQALVEELETTNEEQQASNEELTASNEELQSTNEELHSVNEELHTVNIEYQAKIGELTQLNDDVDNLLKSTEIGVVFLDEDLRIRKFTPAVTTAISLRKSDLDRPLADMYCKFDCPNLFDLLQEVLRTQQPKELEVKLKRSPNYLLMQINLYQTENGDCEGLVLTFIQIDEIKQAQLKLEREVEARKRSEAQLQINQEQLIITQERVENIFSSLEDAIWSFDLPDKKLVYVNNSFETIYGRTKAEFLANSNLWFDVIHPDDQKMVENAHQKRSQEKVELEYRILHPDGSIRWVRDCRRIIGDEHGVPVRQDFAICDLTEKIRVEQALKAKEQSFQAIFNSTFQFIGVLDPKGVLLEANQTALSFGGLNYEDILDRPFWEAKWWTISKTRQKQLKKAIARAARGEFIRYEVDVLREKDKVVTIDFSLKPILDEAGKVAQIILEGRDISELKQAREELHQNNLILEQRVEERTQSLTQFSDRLQVLHRLAIAEHQQIEDLFADYIKAGCQILKLATGIVSEVNEGIYKIVAIESPLNLALGYETPCKDTYCAEVLETKATVTFAEVKSIKSMQNHPVYLNLKLESFIGTPIFVDGNLFGTLNFSDTAPKSSGFSPEEIKIIELMARDIGNSITSIRSKEALKKSELRFRSTFEQAAVGVAHVSLQGEFILVNQRLCDILGYENDALINTTFQEITHHQDLDADLEYVERMIAGEINNYSLEKRYIKQDGSVVWTNLTVSLVRDDSGQPDYFISVVEDISERKEIELDLRQSRIKLEQTNKLEQANQAKDNFIAHMSHELRTPLNSIIGFSHILKKDTSLTPNQLKSVNIVNQSGQHLLTLINDVLDLSKLNANKLEVKYCDLNLIYLLNNIATIFEISTQEKGLTFITRISNDIPTVINTDETKLRQVLFNLLSNAVKFTSTGAITLSASCHAVTVDSDSTIKTVRFEVEDTGEGIPDNQHNTIFAPFEQLDQNSQDIEGTGLGLPICQKILNLMGSKLNLDSQVGRGSRFWFDLNFEELSNQDLSSTQLANDRETKFILSSPRKILVVDDNAENRKLLVEYLQALGFTVEEAANGEEGIAIALEFEPEAILVDLKMPVMNGKEMIATMRQSDRLQNTLVFMISANIHSIADSSDIKCNAFIAKPVDLERLLSLLKQHLELDWQALPKDSETDIVTQKTEMSAPPKEKLLELLELVNCGKLKRLLHQINSLEVENSNYISFTRQIRFLSSNYELDKLEKLIEGLLKNSI